MKRIDEWEQFWSEESQVHSRLERFAPLLALGLAVMIAWL
jgi:hypothetical protein